MNHTILKTFLFKTFSIDSTQVYKILIPLFLLYLLHHYVLEFLRIVLNLNFLKFKLYYLILYLGLKRQKDMVTVPIRKLAWRSVLSYALWVCSAFVIGIEVVPVLAPRVCNNNPSISFFTTLSNGSSKTNSFFFLLSQQWQHETKQNTKPTHCQPSEFTLLNPSTCCVPHWNPIFLKQYGIHFGFQYLTSSIFFEVFTVYWSSWKIYKSM
jgi:hypothetical protein